MRPPGRFATLLTTAALGLGVLGAAGCGGDDEGQDAQEQIEDAGDDARDAVEDAATEAGEGAEDAVTAIEEELE